MLIILGLTSVNLRVQMTRPLQYRGTINGQKMARKCEYSMDADQLRQRYIWYEEIVHRADRTG